MHINELAKRCGCSVGDIVTFLSEQGVPNAEQLENLEDELSFELIKHFEKYKYARSAVISLKPIKLGDLSDKIKLPSGDLILFLLKKGHPLNKNQFISVNLLRLLSEEFGFKLEVATVEEKKIEYLSKDLKNLKSRPPVIVVIGHVDHGKTTLLDFIRKTRVASTEKGGITQHLGAYNVQTSHGDLVFLDTPGHEAFSMMRKRGLSVADLAILMVAADDGVMPQTIESIKQAQDAGIIVVVAINKIDKVDKSRIDVIRQQLSQRGLVSEDWGGQTVLAPISAKTGEGVNELLEILALQSEILELQADSTSTAEGFILDSHIQKGLGATATFLAKHGTLKIGDYFTVGDTTGRVVSITDSSGKKLNEATPTNPVKISGFDALPKVGDYLNFVNFEEYKKAKSGKIKKEEEIFAKSIETENLINLVLKFDTESSKEAIIYSFLKIPGSNRVNVILAGIGNINEGDILMADTTSSIVYGFNVKVEANAYLLAQKHSVNIYLFNIIYKLLEDLEQRLKEGVVPKVRREKTGEAIVKKVFTIKKLGVIAGFQVKQGKILRNSEVEAWRDGHKIGLGKISSLQKDKKSMKEIGVGFEGALLVEGFDNWQEEDKIVGYAFSDQL